MFGSEQSAPVTALGSETKGRQTPPTVVASTQPNDERESELRAEGFGEACEVVHALFSILRGIDPQLEPSFEETKDGKTKYAKLSRNRNKLHFTLWKGSRTGIGYVKISADGPNRELWLERFSKAGFNTRQRDAADDDRLRLNEVTLNLVKANNPLLKEYFEVVLGN